MNGRVLSLRSILKRCANGVSLVVVSPTAFLCWLAHRLRPQSEAVFEAFAHFWAVIPGMPGMYLRRAFYRWTLQRCAADWYIGFGSCFTHRTACVENEVFIGMYALIGSARLRKGALIGSRTSILSGGRQHELMPDGRWSPTRLDQLEHVEIGENCWIGEGVLVMADVGSGAMVVAGSVVSARVPDCMVVAGNPARFVRRLVPPAASEPEVETQSPAVRLGESRELVASAVH